MKFSYLTCFLPIQVEESKHSTVQKLNTKICLICQKYINNIVIFDEFLAYENECKKVKCVEESKVRGEKLKRA